MFERFTDDARQVVVHAQEEARRLGHDHLGTEHLLLGILRLPGDGIAPGVLDRLGVTLLDVRDHVARTAGTDRAGEAGAGGQIPFTEGAKRTLEEALREEQELGHDAIRPEHVLLGLLQVDDEGRRVLAEFDAGPAKVRNEVLLRLGAPGRPAPAPPAAVSAAAAPPPERLSAPAAGRGASALGMVVLGWFGFGAAVGIGLLLGWLIWG